MYVKNYVSLEILKERTRSEKNPKVARRIQIIILAIQGYTAPAIARSLSLSRRSCQQSVQRFNQQGLAGLQDQSGRGRKPLLSPEQNQIFKKRLDAGPTDADGVCTFRGEDLRRILENEFGKVCSLGTVYYQLHQMGYVSLTPRPQHRNADEEAQLDFKKKFPETVQAIAEKYPDKKLRIFFQDEARFGQQGTLTRVWAPQGSRPRAVRQTQYDYLWVIGVVCPETGQAEGLLSPCLNTKMINIFLEQFSETIPVDEHAIVVWDGAGFHRSKALVVPTNMTLIQLPPYSPELNPIENLWHYLKSHFWSNRVYNDFDALMDAAEIAWRKACLDTELMKTVCNTPYAKRATIN